MLEMAGRGIMKIIDIQKTSLDLDEKEERAILSAQDHLRKLEQA
jgi:hypothetical protein